jgi:WD40 repeat protein
MFADASSPVFSPDGQTLALRSSSGTLRLWRIADNTYSAMASPPASGPLAFSPDGQLIAQEGDSGSIDLWDRHSGNLRLRATPPPAAASSSVPRYLALRFTDGGQELLAADDMYRAFKWMLPVGTLVAQQEKRISDSLFGINALATVALSPDGQTIASAPLGRQIFLWLFNDGRSLHALDSQHQWGRWTGHSSDITSLAFSPNGQMLASGGGYCAACEFDSDDYSVRIWRVMTGQQVMVFNGHTADVTTLDWSPDRSLLASGSQDGTVRLWRVK